MNKISINLVTYNGAKYLPFLFNSLEKQTYKDWSLRILDNNSQDNGLQLMMGKDVVKQEKNIGFAAAHNKLFKDNEAEYVLVLNQDVRLEPDCLAQLVEFLEKHQDMAAVSPRLMRWTAQDIIDSFGIKILRNRRAVDRLAGHRWTKADADMVGKLKKNFTPVLGVSATCALYRRSAVQKVGGLFDDNYFAYKEDVDLSFRLQQAGFKAAILLPAVAYHDRSGKAGADLSDRQAVQNKRTQSDIIKYYSYRNHLTNLYKNEYWQNFLLDFPWIFWYEFRKFIYLLLSDRQVLKGLADLLAGRLNLRSQRKEIKSTRKIGWKEMRKFWRR